MKTQHTPGPWTSGRPFPDDLDDYGAGIWIYAADADGFMSSLASVRYGCTEAAEVGDIEANARLIAAAPDLLAALESLVAIVTEETTKFSANRVIPAGLAVSAAAHAIAKAKGEAHE